MPIDPPPHLRRRSCSALIKLDPLTRPVQDFKPILIDLMLDP